MAGFAGVRDAVVAAMSVLVVDVGSSSVRVTRVGSDGVIERVARGPLQVSRPAAGMVEFDAAALGSLCLELAADVLATGPVDAVGIAAQRASTVLWERGSGVPVAPAISWQDLRTTGQCMALRAAGLRLSPNQSATKLTFLLDAHDPTRQRDLCFGTVDTWIAYVLSGGRCHVTDPTNAAVTGLLAPDASGWDATVLDALGIEEAMLARLVDSTGVVGVAEALPGAPAIAGICGDQQASLIGQGCLDPGEAKATFGTGGMLDCVTGAIRPAFSTRGASGTFPIVARAASGALTWGIEAISLSAGTCVEWLRDGLSLVADVAETDAMARSVRDAGSAIFVPALAGLGTPTWDFGARGALIGLDATTSAAQVVFAVLEGIAQSGADLLEAVEHDSGLEIPALRVDGGMSLNTSFIQLLADAVQRPVQRSIVPEATTLGAAFLAGTAVGTWASLEEARTTIAPPEVVLPKRRRDRERWLDARERASRTIPFLSALDF